MRPLGFAADKKQRHVPASKNRHKVQGTTRAGAKPRIWTTRLEQQDLGWLHVGARPLYLISGDDLLRLQLVTEMISTPHLSAAARGRR